jgi:hypothetical protein
MLPSLRITALLLTAVALTGVGRASEDESAQHRPGRAAAHAALADGADLPANPPSFPDPSVDGTRHPPDPGTLGRRIDSARDAENQANDHANDRARTVRDEEANGIAQASAVAAVRSATADAHVAAAQARTNAANAKGAGHTMPPPHPVPKHP